MRTRACDAPDLLDAFSGAKVLTKEQLLSKLGCSWMTIWRLLRNQRYLTSYNHNGRYYTLASIAAFDDQGLWSCGGARFSRYGTLAGTIAEFVRNSEAGLCADEMQQRLHVNVRPTLSRLIRNGSLARHRLAGRFLYVDLQPERAQAQIGKRGAETPAAPDPSLLPDPATAAALLVERIKTPDVEPEVAARRLRRRGVAVTPAQARAVFAHYGLLKKKRLT